MLAQYVAFLFAFNNMEVIWHALKEVKVHLIILSTALSIAGGYIINSFYDQERDLVNRPYRTQFQLLVSKGFTLNLYIFLNVLALMIAWIASPRIFIFFLVFAFLLWFYSHKLSKMVFISEFSATLLSVTGFFSLLLYYHQYNLHFFVFGLALVLSLFGREIYKDLKSIRGDVLYGYQSIATTVGIAPGIRIFQLIIVLSLMVDWAVPVLVPKMELVYVFSFIALTKVACLLCIRFDVVKHRRVVYRILQAMIAGYILGIAWL